MEWASVVFATYIYLCFFRLLKLHLHVRNQTFILLSGRSLVQSPPWWCVSNVTVLHTEQRRCTDTQACVSIGLELRECQAWSLSWGQVCGEWATRGGRAQLWERERASPGNIFRTLWNWGRNGHIPRLLSYLLELSCPSCLFSLVWVFLQPIKSWVTWENVLFPMCMGDGDRLGHAHDEASLCNCYGSAYHKVWVFQGIWLIVSQSEHHISRANNIVPHPVSVIVVSPNQQRANLCVFSKCQDFP